MGFIETSRYVIEAAIHSLSKCSFLRNQTLSNGTYASRGSGELWNQVHVAVKAEMSFDNLNLAQLLSPVTLAAGPNDFDGLHLITVVRFLMTFPAPEDKP